MDMKEDCDEFQRSLEPVVIINDEETPINRLKKVRLNLPSLTKSSRYPIPDISIIPVPRKGIIKTPKEFSPSKDGVTKVESFKQQRKSCPLEKCPICKKYFRRMKTHLLKHEMLSRPPEDRLACPFCKKAFNTQSNMAIHLRTHTGDKPYICEVCNKSFSQSCNLVNHMRVHTGEKPFKCPFCDRAFTQSGNLNNHVRLHTDEKPFKCHFCDKAFVQSGNLNSHIRNNHRMFEESSTPEEEKIEMKSTVKVCIETNIKKQTREMTYLRNCPL